MSGLKTRRAVKFSVDHPWIVIILSLAVTFLLALPITTLKIEPDVQSLLPEDVLPENPGSASANGLSDKLLIMVSGDNLFRPEALQLFEKTYRRLAEILPVTESVDPFSFMSLEKTGSRLSAVPLSPGGKAPVSEADAEVFRHRLENAPFAPGLITSENRDALAVLMILDKTDHYRNTLDEINRELEPLEEILDVSVTGTISFSAETERFLTDGFGKLMIIVLFTILASYYIGFRSKRAVFLPVILVISGTIFSLGLMALAGFKLTMVSIISPPLVLTLGSSYSIHVMNSYYSLSNKSGLAKKELILEAVHRISGTVLLASFTTLIGLMSLLLASIPQTREFAIATSLGIVFTAVLSITLLPAFLVLQPIPEESKLNKLDRDLLARSMNFFGPRILGKKYIAAYLLAAIAAVFFILAPKITFNTSPSKYFPKSSEVLRSYNHFIGKIGGYEEILIQLEGPEERYFLDPDVLANIHKTTQQLKEFDNISYVFSFPEYLSFAGSVMTGKDGYFSSRGLNLLVSRLFSSVKMGDDLTKKDYSGIGILVRTYNKAESRPMDEQDARKLISDIKTVMGRNSDTAITWHLEGFSINFLKLSDRMRRDFLVSTFAAFIAIGLVSLIAFRSVRLSMLAVIPLLTGIFLSLILMVVFKIPLDMTTIMVSCISIGVGIDDSIHFLLQYRRQTGLYPADNNKAVLETFKLAGRPIAITTVSITAGLLFLSLARFQPIRYFGLLIVFTLIAACFATLILLPPLISSRKKGKKETAGLSD